jgi:Transposase DDE domain
MGLVVPKGRKHLCADALLHSVQDVFCQLPDHRKGDPELPLREALMSAFAMFSLKSPSLLAFDKERSEDNLQRVYGIGRVPCDTSMRETLDPVNPEYLRPAFKAVFRGLQRGKALEEMVFVDGHYLLVLDGTGYFSSKEIHCDSCLEPHHRNGTITYSHQMLGAALIHPDKREVIPLMPEPIVKPDGTEKNDGERNAAKRFVTKFRRDHPHLKVIVTEDSLSSNAPHIETLQEHHMHYILGVKEGDHAFLFEQVAQAERAGRVTDYEREDRQSGLHHRFRLVGDVPLNASNAELQVNFIECWETTATGKVQHFSWVTDLRVNKGTVYRLMQGARARWRIENETFNTLKNQGYHFEHNFGHGYQHLSVVFATLMMLAFLVDQVQQLCCPLFQAAWAKWGSKRLLWEKMRALFYAYSLESMRQLFEALYYGLTKSAPTLSIDSC